MASKKRIVSHIQPKNEMKISVKMAYLEVICLWSKQKPVLFGTNLTRRAQRGITGYGHSTNRPGHHGTVVARTVGGVATL